MERKSLTFPGRHLARGRQRHGAAMPSKGVAAFVLFALLLMTSLLGGCRDAVAPQEPPYLAIVMDLDTLPGVVAPDWVRYRVRELSGTLNIDRMLRVAPGDTVILALPPATYIVEVFDVPGTCAIRDGAERGIVLSALDNTGIIRYSIQCRGAVNIQTATDGYDADQSYIWRLERSDGWQQVGSMGGSDTVVLNDVPPGEYEVRLAAVAPNCVVTSDGALRQRFTLDSAGGVTLAFRVQCARETDRPRIISAASSYVLGSSVFTFTAVDPNRDIDTYVFDVTDCRGHSVLTDRPERIRRGLQGGRGRLVDTLTVVGAYDLGLPPDSLAGKCLELRVIDLESNVSAIVEQPLGPTGGLGPAATSFNAVLVGTAYVQSALTVSDADNDVVGTFIAVRVRDGVLGPRDGVPDIGIMEAAGYTTTELPYIPTTGRLRWDDIYAVIVWVIDRRGNAIRLEDTDLLR